MKYPNIISSAFKIIGSFDIPKQYTVEPLLSEIDGNVVYISDMRGFRIWGVENDHIVEFGNQIVVSDNRGFQISEVRIRGVLLY